MLMKRLLICLAALLLTLPAAFAQETVYSGIDTWSTPATGATFTDFARHPIPAGFFCAGSKAFAGKVALRGVPIVTGRLGELGMTDTIVERLDDATFNESGMAITRLQMRSLSLESIAPIRTDCGSYNVRVALAGTQPTTRMRIYKDDGEGGRFLAPLALNVKLIFTPVDGVAGRARQMTQQVRFAADPRARWSFDTSNLSPSSHPSYVRVDTDGDRIPDQYVPGTSNFLGVGADANKRLICHADGEGGQHCINLCDGCSIP